MDCVIDKFWKERCDVVKITFISETLLLRLINLENKKDWAIEVVDPRQCIVAPDLTGELPTGYTAAGDQLSMDIS